jgi:hypothetical protein
VNTGTPPAWLARGVPQRHAHPRQQLAHAEGLGQVIVGAGVERGDLVAFLALGRQHHDRRGRPLTQPASHLQAVDIRQPQVQQNQARAQRGRLSQPILTSGRLGNAIGVVWQRRSQKAPDRQLIFDHQDQWVGLAHIIVEG